jgi:hypothetical protein
VIENFLFVELKKKIKPEDESRFSTQKFPIKNFESEARNKTVFAF